ncbi:M48 family metallopeptidase [Robertmurraya korlensis]|uniref:M48 family metallopeptidase n=1 Tax=Robertmurraya korlensis TaxID=519977 RepID=UPI00203B63D3|nr:M48 family metallopeptidase [Robertmurraya korlensis]MCM3599172.1 M48 family metallopeptidase [Robertmurraya korlensis]
MNSYLPSQLVHRKENIYFALVLTFSILTYIFLVFSILGIGIIIVMVLLSIFFHGLMIGGIRRNGVRISEEQFPSLYEKAKEMAAQMGLENIPQMYVMESQGILNAFATRFFGRNMVVLYSEIFELIERDAEDEVLFVLAHEFAHLKRKHVTVNFLLLPAMWVPFLGDAYLRACEYTCDRYATYYSGSLSASKNALTILAIGKELYKKVNKELYMRQIESEAGFFVWLNEKLSTHPHLPKRLYEVDKFFSETEVETLKEPKRGIVIGVIVTLLLSLVFAGGVYMTFKALEKFNIFSEAFEIEGMTPLMEAASENDTDSISTLLDEGADINEVDSEGSSALHWAVYSGYYEAAVLLLENGADANTVDIYDATPLISAVFAEDVEMVKLLLEYGADAKYIDASGYTAYDYALDYENAELQELLAP